MLEINLKEQYKSFVPFSFKFTGELNIFSGINGSGKTQLVDILKGYEKGNVASEISRELSVNGAEVKLNEIIHKSFRDTIGIGELTGANFQAASNTKNQLWNWYHQGRLSFNPNSNPEFRDSLERVKKMVLQKYDEQKFNRGEITAEEFYKTIPSDFILYPDDIFTNKIGELFWNYATMVYQKKAEAGEVGNKFDAASLPQPPWTQLNNLFTRLNFDYRFQNNYCRLGDDISDQPAIYSVLPDGSADLSQKRQLNDLSDGEKALISLTFAVLTIDERQPKLVVLDEYDATLNPSLIENFFQVIEEFFLSKGISVVVVTHSSATLSLAPENADFYEVYKPNSGDSRIVNVAQDQYQELAVANRKFYRQVADQKKRLGEFENKNKEITDLISNLQQGNNLQLLSEGNNFKHIQKAFDLLAPELKDQVSFIVGAIASTGKQQLKNAFDVLSKVKLSHKILFIWDVDAEDSVAKLTESDYCKKYCFPRNLKSKGRNGIENLFEEHFFTPDLYDEEVKPRLEDGGHATVVTLNKKKFEAKMLIEEDAKVFQNFLSLIAIVKKLLAAR